MQLGSVGAVIVAKRLNVRRKTTFCSVEKRFRAYGEITRACSKTDLEK